MMFGTREPFAYELCDACGSLQIAHIPKDLGRHYPPDYYAYTPPSTKWQARARWILKVLWTGIVLYAPRPVIRLLSAVPDLGSRLRTDRFAPLRLLRPSREARIADVGGGRGDLLRILRTLGFRNLTCIDPFSPLEGWRDGIRFVRGELEVVAETFDLLMYHHVLEHVPHLDREMRAAATHLAPGGHVIARLPLLPNEAFMQYRENWVQIDAPRHLHVPSRSAFRQVAARCGLGVVAAGDDSTEFQFWASHGYAQDVPLSRSVYHRGELRTFFHPELRHLRRRADKLNSAGRGDSGWFVLARAEELGRHTGGGFVRSVSGPKGSGRSFA